MSCRNVANASVPCHCRRVGPTDRSRRRRPRFLNFWHARASPVAQRAVRVVRATSATSWMIIRSIPVVDPSQSPHLEKRKSRQPGSKSVHQHSQGTSRHYQTATFNRASLCQCDLGAVRDFHFRHQNLTHALIFICMSSVRHAPALARHTRTFPKKKKKQKNKTAVSNPPPAGF